MGFFHFGRSEAEKAAIKLAGSYRKQKADEIKFWEGQLQVQLSDAWTKLLTTLKSNERSSLPADFAKLVGIYEAMAEYLPKYAPNTYHGKLAEFTTELKTLKKNMGLFTSPQEFGQQLYHQVNKSFHMNLTDIERQSNTMRPQENHPLVDMLKAA